jgi:hypothetical protein
MTADRLYQSSQNDWLVMYEVISCRVHKTSDGSLVKGEELE